MTVYSTAADIAVHFSTCYDDAGSDGTPLPGHPGGCTFGAQQAAGFAIIDIGGSAPDTPGGIAMAEKRVGVVLAGCGFLDGAEIQEAVATLLALDRRKARIVAMAPDVPQMHVIDHLKKAPSPGPQRSVLVESARIVRGDISPLAEVGEGDLDALVLPGGFGAAKNLCTYAVDGRKMKVNAEVERLVLDMHARRKPMGFICIAPVIAARLLGREGVKLTIGDDPGTAADVESFGAKHVSCGVEEICLDEQLKIVSTPAYMLGPSVAPVAAGIDRLVSAVLEMA
jgi:enhancing lycopene biosynthesis protein 2